MDYELFDGEDHDDLRDDEELAGEFDDYGVYGNDIGNNGYGDGSGFSWFDPDNNQWEGRGRMVPFTQDGLEFELIDLGESFPLPRAGARESYAFDLAGEGVVFVGTDHNGKGYADVIHRDGFSGHLYAIERNEDPSNSDAFPHLAEHTVESYDHNEGNMTNDLYDAMDQVDDEDGPSEEDLDGLDEWRDAA